MNILIVLFTSLLLMAIGMMLLLIIRKRFLKIFKEINDSCAVTISGPQDNFSVINELAGNVKAIYTPLVGGRYLQHERTVLLSYPPGSKVLWALLEAAHEAVHAAHSQTFVELLASTPERRLLSFAVPAALAFLVGYQTFHPVISTILLIALVSFPLAILAAITIDEVRACLLSGRWLSSYLGKWGNEAYQGVVEKMIRAEVVFEVLDGFALFLLFGGAVIFFWAFGVMSK